MYSKVNINQFKLKMKSSTKKSTKVVKSSKKSSKRFDSPIDNSKRRKQDSAKIALKTGYSQSHVCNVLAGRKINSSIVKVAKSITKNRKSK